MLNSTEAPTRGRAISTILAAWTLSLGFDLLLHGGALATVYTTPSPFLLDPRTAFVRIPIGYLAFLILTTGLYWLLADRRVIGWKSGAALGLKAGAVVWGALVLGLYSIATAETSLLLAWWVGQSIELALAGGVIGAALGGARLARIWMRVVVAVFVMLVVVVILQSTGVAPTASI